MPELRPELEPLTERLQTLQIDERGYPIPWFVAIIDGKPDFRMADGDKWSQAVRKKLCWVCGEQLGRTLVFVLGPMCSVTRTTAEPPCHAECARWSARNCPFLARPHMTRRQHEEVEKLADVPGEMIERNPGVSLLWFTDSFKLFNDGKGKILIHVGEPKAIEAYAWGREGTLEQVYDSIESGECFLRASADSEPTQTRRQWAHKDLDRLIPWTKELLREKMVTPQ